MTNNLILVDDHNMYLEGVLSILDTRGEYIVNFASTSGLDTLLFLEKNPSRRIDLVISDISMPEIDGIALVKRIKAIHPNIKVLMVSMWNSPKVTATLLKAGIDGYILKDASKTEFFHAIELLLRGQKYFTKEIENAFLEYQAKNRIEEIKLTKREKQVIKLISEEFTTQEIADRLCLSKHTIETYRKNLISKLKVKNIAGLTRYALKMEDELTKI